MSGVEVHDTAGADQASPIEFEPVGLRREVREVWDARLRPDGNAQYFDVSANSHAVGRSTSTEGIDVDH
jgi:hypothetical protein